MVRLTSPSGVEVLASEEAAPSLLAGGFIPAVEKAPAKQATKPKTAAKPKATAKPKE